MFDLSPPQIYCCESFYRFTNSNRLLSKLLTVMRRSNILFRNILQSLVEFNNKKLITTRIHGITPLSRSEKKYIMMISI